jgi:hypothetical protein
MRRHMGADGQCFYETVGDGRYRATAHTGGPWDPRLQHGGPPEALIAREIRRAVPAEGLELARLTYELLGPLPVGDVAVEVEVARPGRRVQLVEATLTAAGRPAVRARAWQVARGGAEAAGSRDAPPPLPQDETVPPPPFDASGYVRALEWRFTHGGYADRGPAGVWARPRHPLVDDEPLDGLSRLLLLADSANGLSGPLDIAAWYFIPPEATVHLLREPAGEWVHLDAETTIEADGPGVTRGVVSDGSGPIAFVAQTLLVAPR